MIMEPIKYCFFDVTVILFQSTAMRLLMDETFSGI